MAAPSLEPTIRIRVTLPGWEGWPMASFPADVPVFGPHDQRPIRWNGWIACPLFSRAVAELVVKLLNVDHHRDNVVEADDYEWDGDLLIVHNEMHRDEDPDWEPEVIEPDSRGRYAIGGYSYCWFEVDEKASWTPLEKCTGATPECPHFACPDGWHPGDAPNCSCTPDCALREEAVPA